MDRADPVLQTAAVNMAVPRIRIATAAYAIVLLGLFLLPLALGDYWMKAIFIPTLILGLSALGLNLVTGYAGLISLGQGAFMAVGAFTGVIAYGRFGVPLILSLALAGAAAAMIGAIVGLPSIRIRGLYLLVATLAAQFIVVWCLQRLPGIGAGSSATINSPPVLIFGKPIATAHQQYYLTLVVVGAMTLFAANLVRSKVGRAWIAIRDHEVAATVMGISMFRYKLLAFTVSAFYAGVAGALTVFAWVGAANAQEYELNLSISILGMIIIGGLGTIAGSYLGAAFVTLLPIMIAMVMHAVQGMLRGSAASADILANTEHVVFGALILLFLIKEPRGLVHLVQRIGSGMRKRPTSGLATPLSSSPTEERKS